MKNKEPKVLKFQISKLPQVPEGLSQASEARPACVHCKLYAGTGNPFRVPNVPETWTGKVVVVVDRLTAPAIRLIREAAKAAGYTAADLQIVPPLRCKAVGTPKMDQIRACRPFLLKVLEVLQPESVIGMGATALRAITNKADANLTKNRGKELTL